MPSFKTRTRLLTTDSLLWLEREFSDAFERQHSPHPLLPVGYQSNSTGAGISLSCHGTVFGMAFTGLLANMLAF